MKYLLSLLLLIVYAGILKSYAQCGNYNGNINNLPVCGFYGDANGNSNWDWELTDKNAPGYCNNWYARVDASGNLVPMGSPFVDASTTPLDKISQEGDFTSDKGWELLRRDFGCANVTAYPYFILYNRYSGLMRVFVYVPAGAPPFSTIAIEVAPGTNSAYPATVAFSDSLQTAPDKYLTSTPGGNFGKGLVSVGQLGGNAAWSLVEFNPSFDPNIQNAIYTGTSLGFTIYGVTHNNMYASIRGGSLASNQPVYNFTYRPSQPKTPNGSGGFDFKGIGEEFTRFSSGVSNFRTSLNSTATDVVNFLTSPHDSLYANVKKFFKALQDATATDKEFNNFQKFSEAVKAVASLFGTVGAIIGFFTGSSNAGSAAYTNYDLVLQGTITARVTTQTFVLRVPGTVQNNDGNATYYKCPLGIFNLVNTPEADSVTYVRTDRYTPPGNSMLDNRPIQRQYTSYRLRNNLAVSFNDGAGLELVSAQAAFVGEVLPKPDGTASYDLFEQHNNSVFNQYWRVSNHMRADMENGRIHIKNFDTQKKLHVFQSQYTEMGCLNGLSFTVPATTKVYLQVKAVLRKKNDPSEKPILYIQNYKLQTFAQTIDPGLQSDLTFEPLTTFPPYVNYTQLPFYKSDLIVSSPNYLSPTGFTQADNSVATSGTLYVPPSSSPTYYEVGAGGAVSLNPGFEVQQGAEFSAWTTNFGYTLNCTTPQIEAYAFPGNCFNTSIIALREGRNSNLSVADSIKVNEIDIKDIKVYPVPASNTIFVSGIKIKDKPVISILDQSGRTVRMVQTFSTVSPGGISLDVSDLTSGVYFLTIKTSTTTSAKKIVINRH